jgi:protoporphyrinogen IX oxidase
VTWLLLLHVIGNLLWIGSIASVGFILASGREPKLAGELAYALYRSLSVPGFLLSFVAAVILLAHGARHYFVETHWMHAKLPIALVVIAIHHVIGARAKRLASAKAASAGPAGTLTAVLLLAAAGAAYLGLAKPL